MRPDQFSQMMKYLTRPSMARGGRIGFADGTADPEGLAKWVKEFDGTTRPNFTAVAKQFGYKDKSAVNTAIAKVGREDILDLPFPKSKETLRKESVAAKNVNFLDDVEFERLSRNFGPETYDKFKTGSDAEFAEYLNSKNYKAFGNKDFNTKSVLSRRTRLNLPQTNITTRGIVKFSDEDILKEADRMYLKYDVEKEGMKKIRNRVFTARDIEKNLTLEEKEKLYKQRQTPPKTPRQHPYNIGNLKKVSSGEAAKKLFWRDLLTNAQRHQSTLVGREQGLAESHIKFLNPNQVRPTDVKSTFDIKLIDTNVIDSKTGKPKVLTYDNFLKHIDENQKLYRTDSKTAMGEYKKKRFIQENTDLYKKFGKIFGQNYPFHIHHTASRGVNAFNVQFAVGSENMKENRFRTIFNKEWNAAKNFGEQKAAVKKYLNNVPKNLEVRLKRTPYGVRETFVDMTKRIAPELEQQVIEAGGVKLRAQSIPLVENLFNTAASIGDDVKKAKYLKAGFKTLGIAATPLVIYDTYKAFEQGKPVLEALEQGFIGTNIIGGTKDILALKPEERMARSVVKQDALKDLNLNMPMGFGFIEGPTPDTDMTLPEAQQKMDAGIKRVQEERAQRESDIAANRDNFFGNLRDRVFGIGQDYKLELAGGGIAKIAGVDQGPPPESGPNSQGLQGLLKRVRNL